MWKSQTCYLPDIWWKSWGMPLQRKHINHRCELSCKTENQLFIICHLPNCMHPAHCISIIVYLAHSTLFQLTWHWWKCYCNELGAHKFYFCPHCQSWFFNMFLSLMIWMACTAFWGPFLCTTLAITVFSLSLSLYLWDSPQSNFTVSTPGPRVNIKTVLSTYGDFHVKDKTAVRTSYL